MKQLFLLLLLCGIGLTGYNQTKTEYLNVRMKYGSKPSGIINKVWVDIGNSGQHSLSGEITNKDGKVIINGRTYESVIDLLNYFGNNGWVLLYSNEIKILNDTYLVYHMMKEVSE